MNTDMDICLFCAVRVEDSLQSAADQACRAVYHGRAEEQVAEGTTQRGDGRTEFEDDDVRVLDDDLGGDKIHSLRRVLGGLYVLFCSVSRGLAICGWWLMLSFPCIEIHPRGKTTNDNRQKPIFIYLFIYYLFISSFIDFKTYHHSSPFNPQWSKAMGDHYPSLAQCAVVAAAFKILLFPA